jgi:hypothetical protein
VCPAFLTKEETQVKWAWAGSDCGQCSSVLVAYYVSRLRHYTAHVSAHCTCSRVQKMVSTIKPEPRVYELLWGSTGWSSAAACTCLICIPWNAGAHTSVSMRHTWLLTCAQQHLLLLLEPAPALPRPKALTQHVKYLLASDMVSRPRPHLRNTCGCHKR